jgi:hypothetical protein
LLETRQLLSNVVTYHNDNGRTGQNLEEMGLTPANVAPGSFGQLFSYSVDGQVYAQPLYLEGVGLPDGTVHNIVYVATEHDSVYALDANDPTAGPNGNGVLWQTSFIDPANGVLPFSTADAYGCTQISPELGITATPVISLDLGVMYVVCQTKTTIPTTTYHQTIHVLDLTTGLDVVNAVEVQASVINDTGHTVTFNPRDYKERAALTLSNGVLYTAWASHCDVGNAHGWVIGYDANTLQQVSVFNTSPNGTLDTIWQGDGGLAVDPNGDLYFETGNGYDITHFGDDYSEAFMRLSGGDGQTVDDYFIPANFQQLDNLDRDIGSGAPMVIPDQTGIDHPYLLVGGGKDGRIFLLDRTNMGGLNNPPDGPDLALQTVPNALSGGSWDTPAYWDGGDPNGPWIYYAGNGDFVKAFQLQNGLLTTSPTSQSPTRMSGFYGATPIVSANGNQNGIVWTLQDQNPAILHAYDATNLSVELYNSSQVSTDRLGPGIKFTSPIVADSEVFVPGDHYLTVFGLLGTAHSVPGGHAVIGRSVVRNAAMATALESFATEKVAIPVAENSQGLNVSDAGSADRATPSSPAAMVGAVNGSPSIQMAMIPAETGAAFMDAMDSVLADPVSQI